MTKRDELLEGIRVEVYVDGDAFVVKRGRSIAILEPSGLVTGNWDSKEEVGSWFTGKFVDYLRNVLLPADSLQDFTIEGRGFVAEFDGEITLEYEPGKLYIEGRGFAFDFKGRVAVLVLDVGVSVIDKRPGKYTPDNVVEYIKEEMKRNLVWLNKI